MGVAGDIPSDRPATQVTACLFAVMLLLVQGCVAAPQPTRDDPFAGRWLAEVMPGPTWQSYQQWRIRCTTQAQSFFLQVQEQSIILDLSPEGEVYKAALDNAGRFRFTLPLDGQIEARSETGTTLRSDRSLLISGTLSSGEGVYVHAVARFANRGCTSKMTFTQVG